jgi:hypothetical protein
VGLLRTAARTAVVAGTATHVAGNVQRRQQRRWAQQDEAASYEQEQQTPPEEAPPPGSGAPQGYAAPPPAAAPAGQGDFVGQLQQLSDLRQQGAITDEEFAAAKAKLLGG